MSKNEKDSPVLVLEGGISAEREISFKSSAFVFSLIFILLILH